MYIVVVTINEVYTFISCQIVICLLHRQSKLSSEFRNENQCPFYFVGIAIHTFYILHRKSSTFFSLSEDNTYFLSVFLNAIPIERIDRSELGKVLPPKKNKRCVRRTFYSYKLTVNSQQRSCLLLTLSPEVIIIHHSGFTTNLQ